VRRVHATVELLDAMRGDGGMHAVDGYDRPACGVRLGAADGLTLAWLDGDLNQSNWRTAEDTDEVTCPECLKLMLEARGPDADYLLERQGAA
jgi:hypothetical protein